MVLYAVFTTWRTTGRMEMNCAAAARCATGALSVAPPAAESWGNCVVNAVAFDLLLKPSNKQS